MGLISKVVTGATGKESKKSADDKALCQKIFNEKVGANAADYQVFYNVMRITKPGILRTKTEYSSFVVGIKDDPEREICIIPISYTGDQAGDLIQIRKSQLVNGKLTKVSGTWNLEVEGLDEVVRIGQVPYIRDEVGYTMHCEYSKDEANGFVAWMQAFIK